MKPSLILVLSLLLCVPCLFAQETFRVMFYNVENLFDTLDDPDKQDGEFTPEGIRRWTNRRYYTKQDNIAKVITSVGEWDIPAIIGMCEVENDKVLKDLTSYSPLKKSQYRYIITESEDARGIDVALLYQRDRFKYLHHDCIRLNFPDNPEKRTRDILYVAGQVITGDTLDIFVCHFPSRRGGELESEPDRLYAASVVREKVDSLMVIREKANILIMGDFNDEPTNKSISVTMNASGIPNGNNLYNLFHSVQKKSRIGSYKFKEQWNFLDQMIVSGNLLEQSNSFRVLPETAGIFQKAFLLTDDITNGGKRPKKTFHGYKYEGGYSDHLPIYVDFVINN